MFTSRTCVRLLVVACAAVAVALPSVASAQTVSAPRVKVGAFMPAGGSSITDLGNVWFKMGADIDLPVGLSLFGGKTRAEIDYAINGGNHVVPITVSEVWQPSAFFAENPVYFGIGVGYWFTGLHGVHDTTRPGIRLLAGVDLNDRTFLEAQYDIVERRYGTSIDGVSVMIGAKF